MLDRVIEWSTTTTDNFDNIEVLGNEVIIELFTYDHSTKSVIQDLEGNLLSDKYGKEIFNIGKILKVGTECKAPLEEGDIISLPDEMLDPIPDGSKGFTPNGEPKAGYMPIGKLIPYMYLHNKTGKTENKFYFLIPTSWIKIKHVHLQ